MTYFLPQFRQPIVRRGDAGRISWPADTTVTAELAPSDLLGRRTEARSVLKRGAPGQSIAWNANTGHYSIESASYLDPMKLAVHLTASDVRVRFQGHYLIVNFDAADLSEVTQVVQLIEHYILPYLTLMSDVYTHVDRISAAIGPDVEASLELADLALPAPIADDEHRDLWIRTALDLRACKGISERLPRFRCLA